MNLIERINQLSTAIGEEVKKLKTKLISVESRIESLNIINDESASGSTVYSSNKVSTLITQVKEELLGGASEAYDTLKEIEEYITTDKSGASAITLGLSQRLKINEVHTLSPEELNNIQESLKLGNTDTDFVAVFNRALGD